MGAKPPAPGETRRRSTRERLYTRLTEGLGEAVDDLTYPVLSGLARTGPCSAADLGREIGLDRTTVTRRADRLETAGLLRCQPDPADGRATLLALTGDGQDMVALSRERLAAGIEDSLSGWPQADAQAFARLLRRFVDERPFAADHDRPLDARTRRPGPAPSRG
ncbi:MarR family transcriptional regulator [Kitasatospora sp. NBC_01560]